ncbi:hypothetical protein ACSBR2_037895 [Camellia fascicularis]
MDVHKQRQEISDTARPQRPPSNRKPPVSRHGAPHPLHYPLSNLRPNLDPQARHKVLCRGHLTCRGTREVLKDHDTIFANRDVPAVSTSMPYGGRDIVFTPYRPEWNMLRKVCVRDMLGTATLDAPLWSTRTISSPLVFRYVKWYKSMYLLSSMTQDNGEHTIPIDVDRRVEAIWDAIEEHRLEVHELRNEICNLLADLGLIVNQRQPIVDNNCTEGFTLGQPSPSISLCHNVWIIHRDPSIWKNPSNFDPERFLNGEGDYSGNNFNYFPFGSGRRICAGIAMAERMVMFSLASLPHSFDWELPKGDKLDLTEKFGIVLKKKIPLIAIPTPRLPPTLYD